ncbi:MAG: EamA family transporter, partial [bacterium]
MNGIVLALAAAALFGAGTPAAKALLAGFPPQTLAGLLYLGAGAGLAIIRVAAGARRVETGRSLDRRDLPWLAGAIATGGAGHPDVVVTTLADAGPGSLREALLSPNRTITFAVAGEIRT